MLRLNDDNTNSAESNAVREAKAHQRNAREDGRLPAINGVSATWTVATRIAANNSCSTSSCSTTPSSGSKRRRRGQSLRVKAKG